jgi:hypothetical protein
VPKGWSPGKKCPNFPFLSLFDFMPILPLQNPSRRESVGLIHNMVLIRQPTKIIAYQLVTNSEMVYFCAVQIIEKY